MALLVDAALGIGNHHGDASGWALDAVARLRLWNLEIGGVAGNWGTILGPADSRYYGVVAGYQQPLVDHFHLELLAEAGWHDERRTPPLFSASEVSSSVVLPYAGLRAGLDARLGGRFRLVVGLWGVLRADLKSKHMVVEGFDLGTAGGTSVAIQLRIGFELGLGGG